MTIHVTQAHINAGVRQECRTCPIALALRGAIAHAPEVQVMSGSFVAFGSHGGAEIHRLPEAAQDFITAFDAGQPVQPFSFELDIPVEVLS